MRSWQTLRRIKNKILEVKGLRPQTQGNTGQTPTKKKNILSKRLDQCQYLSNCTVIGLGEGRWG